MSSSNTKCGLSWLGYPQFLQRFANTKTFILVYGFLGTIQSMGFVYFAITLQTMEKRFKIPSQTTGKQRDRQSISKDQCKQWLSANLIQCRCTRWQSFNAGLILSGNEVSQILLSVLLAYFGGQRNRWVSLIALLSQLFDNELLNELILAHDSLPGVSFSVLYHASFLRCHIFSTVLVTMLWD